MSQFSIVFRRLKAELYRGYYEVPYLYFTMGLVGISGVIISYQWVTRSSIDDYYTRHKNRYVVLRPDDVRFKTYPRHYITDLDVLEKYEQSQKSSTASSSSQ